MSSAVARRHRGGPVERHRLEQNRTPAAAGDVLPARPACGPASARRAPAATRPPFRHRGRRRGGRCRRKPARPTPARSRTRTSDLRSWPILRIDCVLEERLQPGEAVRFRHLPFEQPGAEQVGRAVPVADRNVGRRGQDRWTSAMPVISATIGSPAVRLNDDGDATGRPQPPRPRHRAGSASLIVSYALTSIGVAIASARPARARSAGEQPRAALPASQRRAAIRRPGLAARRQAQRQLARGLRGSERRRTGGGAGISTDGRSLAA